MILEDTDVEIWRDIEGFDGEYAISTKGRVKNLKNGKILGGAYNGAGYKNVTIKHKSYKVSRLVALAFIPNPHKLPEVNHIDEDKTNNDVSNLEWCSKSDNIRHSTHKYSCKIKQIDKDGELVKTWDSINQIKRELGYDISTILKVSKCKQNYSHGYRWEYCDPKSQRVMNRPVIVYKGNEYIGTFASATKVSEALGLKYISIYYCLTGRLASTHGYSFKYAE